MLLSTPAKSISYVRTTKTCCTSIIARCSRQALEDSYPVRSDLQLRLLQRHLSAAQLIVQVVLHLVFFVEAGPRVGGLRPQVGNVVGAAQLQRNEVIDLVLP